MIIQVRPLTGETVKLMRVPITGGAPELIFPPRDGSISYCARPPSNLCAIAEQTEENNQMSITSFDPVKGRSLELARFDLDPDYDTSVNNLLWSISPTARVSPQREAPKVPYRFAPWRANKLRSSEPRGIICGYFNWQRTGRDYLSQT